MPAITYDNFSGGLDRRLPVNVQEASRLWVLRNAYVTQGKRLKKRPGLNLLGGTFDGPFGDQAKGLFQVNGTIRAYFPAGVPIGLPPPVVGQSLAIPVLDGAPAELVDVVNVVVFQGFEYVVSKWRNVISNQIVYRHHYLDGVTGLISDANCPHSASIAVAASRIFAIAGDVVRYCAAGDATDWTTASDAGFLPTGLQQNTTDDCTAVGTFEDALVVFFPEGVQIWDVAVDPSANQIRKRVFGVGCVEPFTLANWASDLTFLSPFGFRSMTVTEQTDRIDDTDVGVQIDSLVQPDIQASNAASPIFGVRTFGAWIPQLGQYWCIFDQSIVSSRAWVFTYSRSSKIACWSEYTFPVRITGLATVAGKVYLRSATSLYEVSETLGNDAGVIPAVEVQMAFQDAKSPGVLKQVYGADFVFAGSPQVTFKYDPRDLSKETIPMTLTGDTRPGDIVPVEMCAAAMAPVFRHQADEAFELSAVTLYYNLLGIVG